MSSKDMSTANLFVIVGMAICLFIMLLFKGDALIGILGFVAGGLIAASGGLFSK